AGSAADRPRWVGSGRAPRPPPPSARSCTRPSRSSSGAGIVLEQQRGSPQHAAVVAREELDTFLGVLEISGAAAGQAPSPPPHPPLEHGGGLSGGQIARREPVDDLLEALEGVLKCDVAHLAP